MTNDPLELLRKPMEKTNESKNGHKIVLSKRCSRNSWCDDHVTSNTSTEAYKTAFETLQPTMSELTRRIAPILVSEARFKPEQLVEFANEQNVSKFMIAPMRERGREGTTHAGTD